MYKLLFCLVCVTENSKKCCQTLTKGVTIILCYVMLCCFILWARSDALNKQNLMLCYAELWFVMLTFFMSNISCSQWVKSYDLLCSHFWEMNWNIFEQNLMHRYEIDHFIIWSRWQEKPLTVSWLMTMSCLVLFLPCTGLQRKHQNVER